MDGPERVENFADAIISRVGPGGKMPPSTAGGTPAATAEVVRANPALAECLRAGLLCNDSQLMRTDGRTKVQGDPTEAALIVAAEKGGLPHAETHRAAPRVDMIPFESEHMFRATLHEANGGRVIYKVGALERLLERCTDALGENNAPVTLDRDAVHRAAETMAARGLRVLGLARRNVAAHHAKLEHAHVSEGSHLSRFAGDD